MAVTDGVSVTETPRLKRGSMWYASAPSNGPIRGHYGFASVLGVGATLSACGAPPSTRSERLQATWSFEAGSLALQGGVAHLDYIVIYTNDFKAEIDCGLKLKKGVIMFSYEWVAASPDVWSALTTP